MKRIAAFILVLAVTLPLCGCPPLERSAYDAVVGGKASLVQYRQAHQECTFDPFTGLSMSVKIPACVLNNRLTSAKDAIIDAAEIYCSGKDFENGGACNPPAKGTPGYQQAADKLKAAIAGYKQVQKDVTATVK